MPRRVRDPDKPRLLHVSTISAFVKCFLLDHIRYAQQRGCEVEVACGRDDYIEDLEAMTGTVVHDLPLVRAISPLRDLVAVFKLRRILRQRKIDVVHAHTPKGGLIGMVAALLARVPGRVYTVHGLPHMSKTGLKYYLLIASEFVSCLCAKRVLCVSHSIRQVLIDSRLCPPDKVGVVAHGSISGIDPSRFDRDEPGLRALTQQQRAELKLEADGVVLGFIGRLTRDKGLVELAGAWQQLRASYPDLRLLIVGAFETGDPVPADIQRMLQSDPRVIMTGWQNEVRPYMALMNILVLPTYREGLGNVLLEAAAMGIPTIASRVPGCIDAMKDQVTGILIQPRDPAAIVSACRQLIDDPAMRTRMGQAGQAYVRESFAPEPIWSGHFEEYLRVLRGKSNRTSRQGLSTPHRSGSDC